MLAKHNLLRFSDDIKTGGPLGRPLFFALKSLFNMKHLTLLFLIPKFLFAQTFT